MIVSFAKCAPTCITHARYVKPHMLKYECPISMQRDKCYSDRTIIAVQSKLPERSNKRMYPHNAGKQSDEISKTNRSERPFLADKYSAYSDKFSNVHTQFETMWDGQHGSTEAVQQRTELRKTYNWLIYTATYSKVRNSENTISWKKSSAHHGLYRTYASRVGLTYCLLP